VREPNAETEKMMMMTRTRISVLAGTAVLAAAGLGAGVAVAASGPSGQSATAAASPAPAASASQGNSWYRSMMSGYYGSGGTGMMGGSSSNWMMSGAGYQWMTGGPGAPGWMSGGTLPGSMMGTGTDPGTIMGRLFAGAPGPRISAAQAAALGTQVPAGAQVSRAANTITFSTTTVWLTMLASPPGGKDETFRIAGLTNPGIVVSAGARVSIQVINADPGTAHGLVITVGNAVAAWMPMMTARPAFTGSALWFLGSPAPAGMHAGTLTFTATTPGTYRYLCPVPGHARDGMTGTFTVG
jgi:rusticyanin